MTAENRFEEIEKKFAANEAAPVAVNETESVEDKETQVESAATEETQVEKPKKKGLHQRFSELTGQRKALEGQNREKDAEIERLRNELANKRQPEKAEKTEDPNREKTLDDFDWDMGKYLEYQAGKTLEKKLSERSEQDKAEKAKQTAEEKNRAFIDRAEKFSEKQPSFFDDLFNPETAMDIAISPDMRDFIVESDLGPEVAWHLRNNPKEADAIAKLDSRGVDRAMSRIEAKLSLPAPEVSPPNLTRAPPVAKRVGGSSSGGGSSREQTMADEIAAVRAKLKR